MSFNSTSGLPSLLSNRFRVALSYRVNRPKREADYSLRSTAGGQEYVHPPNAFMALYVITMTERYTVQWVTWLLTRGGGDVLCHQNSATMKESILFRSRMRVSERHVAADRKARLGPGRSRGVFYCPTSLWRHTTLDRYNYIWLPLYCLPSRPP
jgi:hypothetical protein